MANYYKFYDTKVIGAKQSLFDVAQGLLVKKMKQFNNLQKKVKKLESEAKSLNVST